MADSSIERDMELNPIGVSAIDRCNAPDINSWHSIALNGGKPICLSTFSASLEINIHRAVPDALAFAPLGLSISTSMWYFIIA